MGARTQSEIIEHQDCCGFNSLKLARNLNLIGGLAMCVCCGMRMFYIFSYLFQSPFVAIGEMGLNAFLL